MDFNMTDLPTFRPKSIMPAYEWATQLYYDLNFKLYKIYSMQIIQPLFGTSVGYKV